MVKAKEKRKKQDQPSSDFENVQTKEEKWSNFCKTQEKEDRNRTSTPRTSTHGRRSSSGFRLFKVFRNASAQRTVLS